jgi:hypothetical protein
MLPGAEKPRRQWQKALTSLFCGLDAAFHLEVDLMSGSEHLRMSVRDSRLELWDVPGAAASDSAPDLRVRFRDLSLKEVLLGTAKTCDAFEEAEIANEDSWRRPLPAGEDEVAASGRFELIPGATLSVAILVTATAFGNVGVRETWRDGALIFSELVPVSGLEDSEADARMTCTLAQLAAIRRRELTPLEALAAGVGLMGEWPQLMCFVELMQHPAFGSVWDAGCGLEVQAAWGALIASPAYREAMQGARAQLEPVAG